MAKPYRGRFRHDFITNKNIYGRAVRFSGVARELRQAPVAVLSTNAADDTVVDGSPITFELTAVVLPGRAVGTAVSVLDLGDDSDVDGTATPIAPPDDVVKTYAEPGEYDTELTLTDRLGRSSSAALTATVTAL